MNKGLHNRSIGKHEDKTIKQVFRIVRDSGTLDIRGASYSPEINEDFVF
jgi:hypothetical protein